MRTLSYVAGILLSAGATPFMTRHLGIEGFGRYVFVVQIIAIVGALTDVGLSNIAVREYVIAEPSSRQRLLRNLLGMRGCLTVCGVASAVVFTSIAGQPRVVVLGTALAGTGLLVAVLQATFQVPLATELRLNLISALEMLKQVVTVSMIVLLVIFGATLLPFFLVTIVGGLAVLVVNVVVVRRAVSLRPAFEWSQWIDLLRDAPAYAVASAVGFVYFRVEVILVSLVASVVEAGSFNASFRIVEILAGIPLLASTSVFPLLARAAREDGGRLRSMIDRMTAVFLIGGVGLALALVVGAPVVIDVAAGADFHSAIEPLQIMGVSLVATFLISVWSFALLALRQHGALLVANAAALAFAIALTAILVPSYGAVGGAIAGAVTEALLAAAYLVLLDRAGSRLDRSSVPVVRIAMAASAALMAAYGSGLPALEAVVVALVAYAGGLVVSRAVPQEILDAFRRRARG